MSQRPPKRKVEITAGEGAGGGVYRRCAMELEVLC